MHILKYLLVANVFAIGHVLSIKQSTTSETFDGPSSLIIDGFVASIEDNPWQVSFQKKESHFCGGSIIGKKWVLTAGHCASSELLDSYTIRVGSSDRLEGGSVIKVKRVIRHEAYNSTTIDFDFSLLELAEELTFSNKIQPITLPNEDVMIEDGTVAMVCGWGTMQYGKLDSPRTLRAVYVPIVGQKDCEAKYREFMVKVTDRMVCAGYEKGGKSPCHGDSGGPLTIEVNGGRVLIGSVSWAYKCAQPKFPEVFGRVASVRPWIKNETGI